MSIGPFELDRGVLWSELIGRLREDLERIEQAHRVAREAATHDEAKPENSKDTRALEQSYLARGQALRVEELRGEVAGVSAMDLSARREGQPVGIGAVVTIEEGDGVRVLFVAPGGGGLALADGRVMVVTLTSPLGRALHGRRVGDSCELSAAGRVRVLEVVEIA